MEDINMTLITPYEEVGRGTHLMKKLEEVLKILMYNFLTQTLLIL